MNTDESMSARLQALENAARETWKALMTAERLMAEARETADHARIAWEEAFVAREVAFTNHDEAERARMLQQIKTLQNDLAQALQALRLKAEGQG